MTTDVDPRRLLTLLALHRHGSVSAAADALHVTPSAISQQLASLEAAVGVVLCDRSERSVRLTPTGEALLDSALQIEQALETVAAEVGRRQAVVAGTVNFGALQSAIIAVVAPALAAVRQRHPKLDLRVREVADASLLRLVRSGELDVATVEIRRDKVAPRGLAEVPILDDPWQVVVPSSWRCRSVAQLVDRPWVSTYDDARTDALVHLANLVSFTPRVVHRCVEYPSVLALVRAGAGAAVVPALALRLFDSSGVKRLSDPGLGSRTISLVHRVSRKEPTAAVRAVIEAVLEHA